MTAAGVSTRRLRKCPDHMPREVAQGYLGRLTAYFGCASPKEFCEDFYLDLTAIQHGEPVALAALAMLTGASHEQLCRWTPRRIDVASIEINGEPLPKRWASFASVRICPVCAKEDIARLPSVSIDQAVYIRSEWMLGLITTCHVHQVQLVEHTGTSNTRARQDFGYNLLTLLEDLDELPCRESALGDFERYLLGRLKVVPTKSSPLLDGLTVSWVSQVCVTAGHDVLRHGGQRTPGLMEKREAGFHLLGNGQANFESVFLELREGLRLGEMALKLLPKLIHSLRAEVPELQRLISAIVDVCFRNLPYAEGEGFLGRACPRRSLYTFYEAVQAYDVGEDRMQAFVIGTPGLAAYLGNRRNDTLIRRDVADRLFRGRLPFVTSSALVKRLGRVTSDAYKEIGYLEGAGVISREPGACPETAPRFYSQPGFDDDMEAFVASFIPLDPTGPGMRETKDLVAMFRSTMAKLWQVLASGKVKSLGLVPGKGLLDAMRFDEREVAIAMTGLPDPVSYVEAAARLKLSLPKMKTLVDHHIIRPDAAFSREGQNTVYFFAPETIRRFEQEYVACRNNQVLVDGYPSIFALRAKGIEPDIHLEPKGPKTGATIYFRRHRVQQELGS